jgi:endonuclease I
MRHREFVRILAFLLSVLLCARAFAAYEAPNPAYNPPANYYNAATGTGTTLLNNLHTIISSMTSVTYGDARYAFAKTDADPAHAGNILLAYTNTSVSGTWDAGVTFNREHVWPKFWLNVTSDQVDNDYKGPASDLFELIPANPSVNSARSNNPYGSINSNGVYSGGTYGSNAFAGDTYWFPSTQNAGEVARAIFYMATRYSTYTDTSTGVSATHSLTLVNGDPTARYTMGDLQSLLKWNYQYGVDNFERARNQAIYSDTYFNLSTNKTVGPQGNRNPFIDHPEYVWAVFGGSANTSQISVASPNVNLGTVFVGGTIPTSNVMISKTGSTPTTYDVTLGGSIVTLAGGAGQPFDYGTVNRTISVGLIATANQTAGLKTGTASINNTDLTSAGAGQGSADPNDVVNVSATVLAHANPSFNSVTDLNSLSLNFGTVYVGGSPTLTFSINGLNVAPGFTAPLKLTGSSKTGDAAVTTNLATFTGLAAGSSSAFNVGINTTATGGYSAAYTLTLADDVTIAGALTQQLTLNVSATIAYLRGDFNVDGQVTGADIPAMLKALTDLDGYEASKSLTPIALLAIGDFSGDGMVSNFDLQPLLNLVATSGSGSLAAVPEPSTILLAVLGVVAAYSLSWKWRLTRCAVC